MRTKTKTRGGTVKKASSKKIVRQRQASPEHPFSIGEKYLIRTVTHYHVGELVSIVGQWAILKDAAWVADTGRFNKALTKFQFAEVEPFPNTVYVNLGSCIDITPWGGRLPLGVK